MADRQCPGIRSNLKTKPNKIFLRENLGKWEWKLETMPLRANDNLLCPFWIAAQNRDRCRHLWPVPDPFSMLDDCVGCCIIC